MGEQKFFSWKFSFINEFHPSETDGNHVLLEIWTGPWKTKNLKKVKKNLKKSKKVFVEVKLKK